MTTDKSQQSPRRNYVSLLTYHLSLITDHYSLSSSRSARNHHCRRPQKAILQAIAAADLSNDMPFGNFIVRFVADRFMQVGIKLFSHRIDRLQSTFR
jgi:hypothetical protein